uniref:AlNc14C278G10068 protein n=1 Tax=Albugo laibachii Nc14 TaxID=890382 RepID=F0WUR5_9STRA|nr:AlNc14C278G10068 [Albugo laibachii Nc14]|eukprot:CCA25149.1 AlNc14C278G10068 [Albugo laibachii Nc14]
MIRLIWNKNETVINMQTEWGNYKTLAEDSSQSERLQSNTYRLTACFAFENNLNDTSYMPYFSKRKAPSPRIASPLSPCPLGKLLSFVLIEILTIKARLYTITVRVARSSTIDEPVWPLTCTFRYEEKGPNKYSYMTVISRDSCGNTTVGITPPPPSTHPWGIKHYSARLHTILYQELQLIGLQIAGTVYHFGLTCIGEISVCNRDQFLVGLKVKRETKIDSSHQLSTVSLRINTYAGQVILYFDKFISDLCYAVEQSKKNMGISIQEATLAGREETDSQENSREYHPLIGAAKDLQSETEKVMKNYSKSYNLAITIPASYQAQSIRNSLCFAPIFAMLARPNQ